MTRPSLARTHRDPGPGPAIHDRRQGRGEYDLEENFSFLRAEGARHFNENAVDLLHPCHRIDDDDEYGKKENHGDTRLHAESEPENQYRHKRRGWRGHERIHIEIQKMLNGAKTSHQKTDNNTDEHREQKTYGKGR